MKKITLEKLKLNTQFFKLSLLLVLFLVSSSTWAQINDGGSPVKSFENNDLVNSRVPVVKLPRLDLEKLKAEDDVAYLGNQKATRFGVIVPKEVGFEDGVWDVLPNGDRIWRVQVEAEDAKALNLYFDDFYMPLGARLHVYSANRVQILGGFGAHNNSEHNTFATSLIYGDNLIVEYFEPSSVIGEGRLQISDINHAYRMIDNPYEMELRDFGDSDSCQVNVNCSEGTGKEEQRDAVARILVRVGALAGWCTGTVVNNVRQDCTPYFLTALHCADDGTGSIASQTDFNQWIFYFNFQAAGCANPSSGNTLVNETVTGANMRAHSGDPVINTGSDMLLLEFQNAIPASYNVFYAGWDRGAATTTGGYSIHHPFGDIKKISTFAGTTQTTGWASGGVTHWAVQWVSTANGHGVTEGGSSGSGLFNSNGRLIGTLSGGSSFCSNTSGFDAYGKMSYHWTSNTTPASLSNLQVWLDPDNTNATTLDGVYYPCDVPTTFNDSGITGIVNPADNSFICDNPYAPEVTLKNFGLNTLFNVVINYRIDSGAIQMFNWSGSLLSNASTNVVLPSINVPSGAPFVLEVYTTLPNNVMDTDSINDSSSVTAELDVPTALPFTADFDTGVPAEVALIDPGADGLEWEHTATVDAFGGTGGSLVFDNFTSDTSGTQDYIFLPTLDFSNVQGASLTFDVAYAQYNDSFFDGLAVVVSDDCGENYVAEFDEQGSVLATAPNTTTFFSPSSTQWVTKSVDLSGYDLVGNVSIVFINVGGYGQALYVDNINVNYTSLGVEEEQLLDDLVIFPNPASDVVNIKSTIELEKVELYSVLGEKIFESDEVSKIDVNNLSTGVYLLMIYSENAKSVRRIIVE